MSKVIPVLGVSVVQVEALYTVFQEFYLLASVQATTLGYFVW